MLPKVASQLLHHTSRAVAVIQNQTGYTIRNVLQSSPGTSSVAGWNGASSSSGWGGAGTGAGGAKFSGSSRFYSGYTVCPPSLLHKIHIHNFSFFLGPRSCDHPGRLNLQRHWQWRPLGRLKRRTSKVPRLVTSFSSDPQFKSLPLQPSFPRPPSCSWCPPARTIPSSLSTRFRRTPRV